MRPTFPCGVGVKVTHLALNQEEASSILVPRTRSYARVLASLVVFPSRFSLWEKLSPARSYGVTAVSDTALRRFDSFSRNREDRGVFLLLENLTRP